MRIEVACGLQFASQNFRAEVHHFMMSERNVKSNVDGYIHNVSAINTAKSGNYYFDFTIQENEEQRRVVCFSPEKRSTLKTKEERKLPVRLVNVSPQKTAIRARLH